MAGKPAGQITHLIFLHAGWLDFLWNFILISISPLQMLNYLEECGGIQEEGILRICGETNRMRVWSGGFVQI